MAIQEDKTYIRILVTRESNEKIKELVKQIGARSVSEVCREALIKQMLESFELEIE